MTFNVFNFLHNSLVSLNTNKFFAGLVMLVLNIGSKFITIEFSENQEEYLRNNIGRQILIFSVFFMATKDIYVSILMTASFFILSDHLFNEESRFCVLPKSIKKIKKAIDKNEDGDISDKELNQAIRVLEKAKQQKQRLQKEKAYHLFHSTLL